MGNSKFTAHYWRHKCPVETPEDGDDVHGSDPNVKYDKIPRLERALFKEESLLGKKCSIDGCKYEVNEETVILNKDMEEIRNLGGKNLYPDRTQASCMECCNWRCRNRYTYGHSLDNPNFNELNNHCCGHALDYQWHLPRNLTQRLPGCTCVMLNRYNEKVKAWEPEGGRERVPHPGGPLHLDNKYWEKKKKEAGGLAVGNESQ
ncbi:hypothetical protein C8A01DRAFT_36485 [Parachaetomium inaequale]|uniref:Uncharacterized protein n=1 Tax=Parachaetomium inaequale TaxID=2588326 RepID=A0AAN6SR54_9PEZI|nr:hypothetical protein C8A01DRAFT_36485 [Parachaetomium inaequale]